ncbi:MAG: AMP-binding protein, partial [Desulfobacterales bacterium]|nr:AMP-binding protein [Desulfobacterales bacterium]
SFDFSVWEMYGALLYGGSVVVAPREEVRDVEAFHALIHEHGVTVLNQTPPAFYNLMETARKNPGMDLGRHLRWVIFGGDRLEPAYLKPWVAMHPLDKIRLVNMYGITETTVHVTFGLIRPGDVSAGEGRSPIGAPLPETRVYVCDREMNLKPIGVPGEMYVGGTGVSRGYLNRPRLTKERFLRDPFHSGERFYRTGDLGRWREDGTLEHLGRNDFQVQVRGFRIELGEIEAALLSHPAVWKAAVIAREEAPGAPMLAAYIVPGENARAPSASTLRDHLLETLPEYMAPSAFVTLPAMPLTANGKVDRRALPAPDQIRPDLETAFAPPENEVEEVIADAWRRVLKKEKVGVLDNFFDLGGHSLTLIQVNNRLQETFPDLAMVDLFKHPTIRSLARRLGEKGKKPDGVSVEEIDHRAERRRAARRRRRGGVVRTS